MKISSIPSKVSAHNLFGGYYAATLANNSGKCIGYHRSSVQKHMAVVKSPANMHQ